MDGFNWVELSAAMPGLSAGLMTTLKLLVMAVLGGMIIGTLLALARLSGFKWLSMLAKLYVN